MPLSLHAHICRMLILSLHADGTMGMLCCSQWTTKAVQRLYSSAHRDLLGVINRRAHANAAHDSRGSLIEVMGAEAGRLQLQLLKGIDAQLAQRTRPPITHDKSIRTDAGRVRPPPVLDPRFLYTILIRHGRCMHGQARFHQSAAFNQLRPRGQGGAGGGG